MPDVIIVYLALWHALKLRSLESDFQSCFLGVAFNNTLGFVTDAKN